MQDWRGLPERDAQALHWPFPSLRRQPATGPGTNNTRCSYRITSVWFCNITTSHPSTPYDVLGDLFEWKLHITTPMSSPYQPRSSRRGFCQTPYVLKWPIKTIKSKTSGREHVQCVQQIIGTPDMMGTCSKQFKTRERVIHRTIKSHDPWSLKILGFANKQINPNLNTGVFSTC